MKTITNITAAELISKLQANKDLGIAFNQSGNPLQIMTFRDFLSWYSDATNTHLSVEGGTYYDEDHETEVDTYNLVERCAGKKAHSVQFFSEEEADNAYFERLERRYNDDNGAGGIFYPNADAIVRLEDESDEWHLLFESESEEQTEIIGRVLSANVGNLVDVTTIDGAEVTGIVTELNNSIFISVGHNGEVSISADQIRSVDNIEE